MNDHILAVPTLELQLTDTCQHNCVFCANGDGSRKSKSFTPEELREIFRRIHAESVIFTGGEPTTRMDLLTSGIRMARDAGAGTVKVNTNMELLNPERLMRLEEAGLNVVHFALNTLQPEKHRTLRGNLRGAEVARVCENIRAVLNQTRLRLKPEFVCLRENMEDFWEVYDYLDELHAAHPGRFGSLELQRTIPIGRASNLQSPTMDEIIAVMNRKLLGALNVDAYCFGQNGARLAPYGINVMRCMNHTDCGCSLVRVDVNGGVSSTNFSGLRPVGNIMNITATDIERLLSSPCPLAGLPDEA